MSWEVDTTYLIEATDTLGAQRLTYVGEIHLEWTLERVHVFKATDGKLVGLRDEDVTSASATS